MINIMTLPIDDHENLMTKYVAICNEALLRNANQFPFMQILDAAEKSAQGRLVEARVADIIASDSFILSLINKRIKMKSHDSCKDCNCDYRWDIDLNYLQDVIKNPAGYISNPARMDWDWLYADG